MIRIPSLLLLCLSLLAPAITHAQQPQRAVFQKLEPCRFQGLDEEILCGTLSVWENRASKSGRKIDLNVDPATPPEWAAEVAKGLPHSANVVIREGAHGPGGLDHFDCYVKLINDFIVNGTPYGVDTSCVKDMKRKPFLTQYEPVPED
jgi:TAP-like protein